MSVRWQRCSAEEKMKPMCSEQNRDGLIRKSEFWARIRKGIPRLSRKIPTSDPLDPLTGRDWSLDALRLLHCSNDGMALPCIGHEELYVYWGAFVASIKTEMV